MPKSWLYHIALVLPFIFRLLVLNTNFVDLLWYHQKIDAYNMFNTLRVSQPFLEFIGGWALPVFIVTVLCYWHSDGGEHDLGHLFLLLPIAYVPFTILADVLVNGDFNAASLYIHPLVIIPLGYLYIFMWTTAIWVFDKCRLVV